MKSFDLKLRLKVETKTAVNTSGDADLKHAIANYAMVQMGGRLKQFEGPVGEDGILDIDHTFEEIGNDHSYHNQMRWEGEPSDDMKLSGLKYNQPDDTKIKSHFTIWLYRRRVERKTKSDGTRFDASGEVWTEPPLKEGAKVHDDDATFCEDSAPTPYSPTIRCYLIGSNTVDMAAVMECTVKLSRNQLPTPIQDPEGDPPNSFRCAHNFCDTYSTCEILALTKQEDIENVEKNLRELKEGLELYRKNPGDANKFMVSPLQNLFRCNEVVRLQQVQFSCSPFFFVCLRTNRAD